jgi:hypothetical protein
MSLEQVRRALRLYAAGAVLLGLFWFFAYSVFGLLLIGGAWTAAAALAALSRAPARGARTALVVASAMAIAGIRVLGGTDLRGPEPQAAGDWPGAVLAAAFAAVGVLALPPALNARVPAAIIAAGAGLCCAAFVLRPG